MVVEFNKQKKNTQLLEQFSIELLESSYSTIEVQNFKLYDRTSKGISILKSVIYRSYEFNYYEFYNFIIGNFSYIFFS